ncbi:MAG: DegT/DnrJ/EryC1/StrS family aminotransferase [Chloroflexi bacterium]|nr:DegT/DnrJ/EryC1/StrS family aminotransferase [Chloroflexota bacterium]
MSDRDFIPMAVPVLGNKELEYVTEAVRSGWISSQGRYVSEFEESFSAYCGVKYGIAVTSGTTALHLALVVLGIGPGDEVIIPPLTHIACANMITLTGARPVLVDCAWDTWGIDPAKIEEKITSRTKAIMVIHLYGHPVDMDPVLEIAEKYGLYVIEDAAEAHGAEYKGRRTGSLGHIACFSFYANKIITTGEGGMIVTDDPNLAAKARKLRDQAYEKERRFWHRELGFNYRMTNLQAAIGLAQIEKIDQFVNIRRRNAHLYNQLLNGIPGLILPPEANWAKNVYWMYSILVDDSFGMSRDELIAYLKSRNIDARPFFYPVHLQPLYADQFKGESYPVAEELSSKGMNLPSGNELTEDEVRRIADTIKSARGGR